HKGNRRLGRRAESQGLPRYASKKRKFHQLATPSLAPPKQEKNTTQAANQDCRGLGDRSCFSSLVGSQEAGTGSHKAAQGDPDL
ncbi:hypothetical protein N9A88_01835, partial [Akkermansiaceae bacterium]|nr:hypothetical protein [Akkermansiaceae bacterium]